MVEFYHTGVTPVPVCSLLSRVRSIDADDRKAVEQNEVEVDDWAVTDLSYDRYAYRSLNCFVNPALSLIVVYYHFHLVADPVVLKLYPTLYLNSFCPAGAS